MVYSEVTPSLMACFTDCFTPHTATLHDFRRPVMGIFESIYPADLCVCPPCLTKASQTVGPIQTSRGSGKAFRTGQPSQVLWVVAERGGAVVACLAFWGMLGFPSMAWVVLWVNVHDMRK